MTINKLKNELLCIFFLKRFSQIFLYLSRTFLIFGINEGRPVQSNGQAAVNHQKNLSSQH